MSADPFRHSLVHVFLEEELGGERPPDLSQDILAKAFGDEKPELESSVAAGTMLSSHLGFGTSIGIVEPP